MNIYCSIFTSFFKVGTFTIGGGYAMIPLMEREVVDKHHWMSEEEFMDEVALCQALPGVFAVNMAAMTGRRLCGWKGSVAAVIGNVIVPVVLILILACFYRSFKTIPLVEYIFMGIRPAVAALIAAPVFSMAKSAKVSWRSVWIPIVSAMLIWLMGVNPVVVVVVAAIGGWIYGRMKGGLSVNDTDGK